MPTFKAHGRPALDRPEGQRHWNLFVQGDVGGFGAGSDISVNALAMLGYRLIYEDYERADFTGRGRLVCDVQQRGPLLGLSMLF